MMVRRVTSQFTKQRPGDALISPQPLTLWFLLLFGVGILAGFVVNQLSLY
jgi:hypothetical protein